MRTLYDATDLSKIARNLELGERGIWHSRTRGDVSYPEGQSDECFAIEDGSYWFQHRAGFIVDGIGRYPPPGPLFDVGGGNGHVAAAIEAAGTKVVLVEPGHRAALNARARGVSCVVNSSLQEAGFLPRSLAAVGLFDVLEHVADDEQFLALLHELIAPGGRLYLTVPAHRSLWSAEDVAAGHYRRYTLNALCKQLTGRVSTSNTRPIFSCCCRFPFFSFVQCQAA